MLKELIHDWLLALAHLERRYEPFVRPQLNALLREPSAAAVQALINLRRPRQSLRLAEEQYQPGEDEALGAVLDRMSAYMRSRYRPGEYERGGNTKTHGLVRAELLVDAGLPPELRHGILAEPRRFPAWVRFAGPGPDSPPDIEDIGVLSMSVKLMGVPGRKLLDDEKHTQDLLCVSTPTFVTPNVAANAQLQAQVLRRTPLYYFLDPQRHHLLDLLMQALWSEAHSSPLECRYYSCVPYLLGQGQAMQYSLRPVSPARTPIPNLPGRPPDHYLRDAMVGTLSQREVEFELLVQLQTDPHAMPIEDAAVRWPEQLSPWVKVATLRIPAQVFDSPAQLRFAAQLAFSPWHAVPEHRPLGNQNRARRRLYAELARLRMSQNQLVHYEPDGNERFELPSLSPSVAVRDTAPVPSRPEAMATRQEARQEPRPEPMRDPPQSTTRQATNGKRSWV